MKELEQKYIDILEQNDWGISSYTDDGRVELETYSPAGENFLMCVEVENFPESVREYANDFDADEHTEMWIEARGRVAGVPNSIRELIEDAEAIKEMLNELADTLVKDENNKTFWLFSLAFFMISKHAFILELGSWISLYKILGSQHSCLSLVIIDKIWNLSICSISNALFNLSLI